MLSAAHAADASKITSLVADDVADSAIDIDAVFGLLPIFAAAALAFTVFNRLWKLFSSEF